jgi:hypothetical protein
MALCYRYDAERLLNECNHDALPAQIIQKGDLAYYFSHRTLAALINSYFFVFLY